MADKITRRLLLKGGVATGAALVGLSCAGAAVPAPEPAPPAPSPERGKAKVPRGKGSSGTLFKPKASEPLPRVNFVQPPSWFRDLGGLYCPAPRSAGSSLLMFTEHGKWALSNRIKHFHELPTLLDQAKQLGTNLVYLVDYYEGWTGLDPQDFWRSKGSYTIRADLGGEEAFKKGVAEVHRAGGKVMLYVEPFVIHKETDLGKRMGQKWSIKTKDGYPDDPYPDDWKLCPHVQAFADHMVEVAGRLVGDYGADGLFLDSYGYQKDWKCVETAHGHGGGQGDAEVFNEGAKRLVKRMHAEVIRKNPEAVLMCEGPKLPAMFEWISASQDWGANTLVDRWQWNGVGKTGIFTSGWNLDDVHQVVALGHRLTLGGNYWFEAPPVPTCAGYFAANLKRPIRDRADQRFRRFFAEDHFQNMHKYRNAGLLAGRDMPNLDEVAPRRWDRQDAFKNHEGLIAILEACAEEADNVDACMAGAPLIAPTAHIKKLVEARAALSPVLVDTTVSVVDSGNAHVAVYRFDGPNGKATTAVNVSATASDVPLLAGRHRELVTGEVLAPGRKDGGGSVPGHSVRMWVRGPG